jgi:hypothetical protein
MSVGYSELQRAASLLENANALQEQKMFFGKGSSEDIAKLATSLRNEAYDLLQGKTTVNENFVLGPKGQTYLPLDINVETMSKGQVEALLAEVQKKLKKFADEDETDAEKATKPRVAGVSPQATQPSPSMPKTTPTEAAPVAEAAVDVVPAGDIHPPREDDGLPSNVSRGMRAPKLQIPEDTTKRRPTPPKG